MTQLISKTKLGLLVCSTIGCLPFFAHSAPIGMVVNNTSKDVIIFDAANDSLLGAVNIGEALLTGDCSVTSDETLGFVTNFNYELKTIDLSDPAFPVLVDSIAISNAGEDTSVSSDQKYVVVSDGGRHEPLSVVDISSRLEINSYAISQYDHNSVEVLSDGTVLTTSYYSDKVFKLSLDESGSLTDTGLSLAVDNVSNVYAEPGAKSGFVAQRSPGKITSFVLDTMSAVDERLLPGTAQSAVFSPMGDRIFVRTDNGYVVAYSFNAVSGSLGDAPEFQALVGDVRPYFGMEKIAISADGTKLYLPSDSSILVLDSENGQVINTIAGASLEGQLTGICFASSGESGAAIAPGLHKVMTNGPDIDGSGSIDLVVEAGQPYPAQYEFDVRYSNPEGPEVIITDKFSSKWDTGLLSDDNGNAFADAAAKGNGPTNLEWMPEASGGTISFWAETRATGSKKKPKYTPNACGALKLGGKATALEFDPLTGKLARDEFGDKLPPVMESNELCIAVVKDLDGNGIQRDGSGDEDGDGINDIIEACEIGSDPCSDDTDSDGILDALDACPLEQPVVDTDGDGCED